MKQSLWLRLIVPLTIMFGMVSTSFAQPPSLTYGGGVIGQLNATAPLMTYSFVGEAGDLVTLQVIGVSPEVSPTLSVNSPIGQQIAFTSSDSTTSGEGNARADILLPDGGTFNVQVGSLNGSEGQFVLRLDGVPTQDAPTLQTTALLDFTAGPSTQVLVLNASPDSPMSLQAPDADMVVHQADGTLVGVAAAGASFTIPAGDTLYYVAVSSQSTTPVEVTFFSSGEGTAPSSVDAAPTTTAPTTDATVCTITTGGTGTNLRAGPGIDYSIIASLAPGQSYPVTGQNSGWYTINYNGAQGWMAASVTTLSGPCNALPTVPAPTLSSATQTSTPLITASPSSSPTQPGIIQATPTVTPTEGPTQQASATATAPPTETETSAQVAPPDSAHFVEVNIKGGQATHSDAVSYPDGDVEDEVFWNVSGFDSITQSGDLQIIVSCTGDGQSNVVFRMGTSTYSCGDVIDRFVTNDSDQGLIRVTATGGSNILVNYTLLFIGST